MLTHGNLMGELDAALSVVTLEKEDAILGVLPQGQIEHARRVATMVDRMDDLGFGSCSNEGECEAVCPKEVPISTIARMTAG